MITAATEKDYPVIVEVWEKSVRATHDFLPEDYLQEIKILLPDILPHVQLFVWKDDNGLIKGFAGVAQNKIEMLFIHPASIGKGLGKTLARFCVHTLNADTVDVNEQNKNAVAFYKKIGYHQTGKQELDSMGRPFPLLQMKYVK